MANVSKIKLDGQDYIIKDNNAARESLIGTTDPTTSTVGVVGQFYTNSETNKLFQCTAVASGVYTWEIVGGVKADEVYIGPTAPTEDSVKFWLDTASDGAVIDPVPTKGSPNAVSSGGVYTALSSKADVVNGEIATTSYQRLTGFNSKQNTNLNNIKYTGQYGIYNTCTNRPSGSTDYGILEVIMYSSQWLIQRYTAITTSGSVEGIWYRTFINNTTWSSWKKYSMGSGVLTASVE